MPRGDAKNLACLATSINVLFAAVIIPPRGISNAPLMPGPTSRPHRCGSELLFLWIPLRINGCFIYELGVVSSLRLNLLYISSIGELSVYVSANPFFD